MTDCNADLLNTARANVADRNNPAHRRAICERGEWDAKYDDAGNCVSGTLMHADVARLLKQPIIAQGEDA